MSSDNELGELYFASQPEEPPRPRREKKPRRLIGHAPAEKAPRPPAKSKAYFLLGQRMTFAELLELSGLSEAVLRWRLRRMSIERAVLSRKGKAKKTYEVNGKRMTLEELSALAGVKPATIWMRIEVRGESPERAALDPTPRPRGKHADRKRGEKLPQDAG